MVAAPHETARDTRPVICFPLAGDSLGGSHHSLLGLLRQLDARTYRILVIVERPGGKLAHNFADFAPLPDPAAPHNPLIPGNPVGLGKFLRGLKGLLTRARFLREQGVRIVHTNDGRSHAAWALAAKLAGARLLWHHRADPAARGLRLLAPWVADQIVTVSRFSLPRSKRSHALRKAQVVFSPFDIDIAVDRDAMRDRLRVELDLPEHVVIVGYFGSFIDRKRPLLFVEAIARLHLRSTRPVCGVMFGEAELPEVEVALRRRIADLQLDTVVRLMGYRSPGADWIAGCDILAVPAVSEPLGRTLVEAMLVGTPVVATRSGGNPEAIVDGTGILVSPDDAAAMASACSFVIDNPSPVATMTAAARASARERFARSRHVWSMERIYRELLAD
nr:glycosyltransferase family 4 protein [Novosphingobium hassiacum]